MKKIMIIGKLNSTTKEIYNGLAQYSVIPFQVQICVNQMELIKPMMQMIEPDFVIMSLSGVEKRDVQIASELQINYVWTPVLCCGTEMELVPFHKFMTTKQFDRLQRPFEVEDVVSRLKEQLKIEGPDIPTVKDLLNLSETSNEDYAPQDSDWNIDFDQSEIDRRIAEALQRKQKEQESWVEQAQAPQEASTPQEASSPQKAEAVAPPKPPKSEAPAASAGGTGKLHILLVDDNAIQLRTLRSFLVKDYDVSLAVSGDDAVVQMEKHRPDLVFLDYEMPGSNGRDVLARIRQLEWAKNLPVVFLTGLRDKDKIRELMALKPSGYMLKPADAESVKQMIKRILG